MIHQPLTQTQFAMRAEATSSRIISALSKAVHAVGVEGAARPTDIAAHLKIDMKLAWKVSHLLRAESPAEVVGGLPGRSGFMKLLSGLKQAGASLESVDALQLAFDELVADVASHAGNKSTYDSMVLGMGSDSELPLAVGQRRALNQSMASVIGVQCRSFYGLDVIGPRLDSGGFDRVSMKSYDGIFRLWSGVPWCLRLPRLGTFDEGDDRQVVTAFDDSDDLGGRLLMEFSGLSGIKVTLRSDKHARYEDFSLESDGIGPRHAARIVHGCRIHHARFDMDRIQSIRIDLPVHHAEMDLIMHRSWLDESGSCEASVHHPGLASNLGSDDSWTKRLPIELTSTPFDDVSSSPAPVGWSATQHAQLIGRSLDALEGESSDYVLHRVHLSYPPLPVDLVHGVTS